MSSDASILTTINSLVGEVHELRTRQVESPGDPADLRDQLQRLEVELDRCWGVLNQRRALRAVGANPDAPKLRRAMQVKEYRQ